MPKTETEPTLDDFTDDELGLLLKVLQETHFIDWPSKILGGQAQQRIDAELKRRS